MPQVFRKAYEKCKNKEEGLTEAERFKIMKGVCFNILINIC